MEVEFQHDSNGIAKDTGHKLIQVHRVIGQDTVEQILEQMAQKSKRNPEYDNLDSVDIEPEIRNGK